MKSLRPPALTLAALLVAATAGCTNDKTLTGGGTTFNGTFHQIARVGRPLVIELYAPWADHDTILRSPPSSDPGQLSNDTSAFMTSFAKRSLAISTFVAALFARGTQQPPATFQTVSNVLVFDLSQTGPATYLGVESGGRITSTGGVNPSPTPSFGGRALTDDVMAITLQLTFGSLVPAITTIPDDGAELDGRNGRPNLANDNVTFLTAPKHFHLGGPPPFTALQFPYLGDPR
jgi:uncharacterized protein DUF4331